MGLAEGPVPYELFDKVLALPARIIAQDQQYDLPEAAECR